MNRILELHVNKLLYRTILAFKCNFFALLYLMLQYNSVQIENGMELAWDVRQIEDVGDGRNKEYTRN